MGFLDNVGLSYLWDKIKEKFLGREETTPIVTITKNEYDNLSTEDKKKDVIYTIIDARYDDPGPGWFPANDYSLEEQRIGTWVDGKPLYRKTVEGVTGGKGSWFTIASILDMDHIIDFSGFAFRERDNRWTDMCSGENGYVGVVDSSSKLEYYVLNPDIVNTTCIISVSYTKTTD